MLNLRITFPTHFCYTCVVGDEKVEVLLTECGHRICRICLEFGIDEDGGYKCSICFVSAWFVHKSPLRPQRPCSKHLSSVSKTLRAKDG